MSGQPFASGLFKTFLQISTTSLPTESKIDQILQALSETVQADLCLFLTPDQIHPHGLFSQMASDKKALWIEEGHSYDPQNLLPEERRFLYPTFVCVPLSDGDSFLGMFYLGFSATRSFHPEEIDLLILLSKGVGDFLRHAALHQEAEQTISELTALHTLGKAVSSTLKPAELFDLILQSGMKTLQAEGGVLRLKENGSDLLRVRSSEGDFAGQPFDEKIARHVFFSQTPFSQDVLEEEAAFHSVLCVPLLSKGRGLGTLAFYNKETKEAVFDEKDFQLLQTMASQISCSIDNAMTHDETSRLVQEHQRSVRQLSTLCELNKALLTTVYLERILQITLTAITHGEGLGFNRAMLFLVDEETHTLKGQMAVGPDSPEEAGAVWKALSQRKGSPSEAILQLDPSSNPPTQLNRMVKGTDVSLDRTHCILVRTILEKRPFNIHGNGDQETECKGICGLHKEIGCLKGMSSSEPARPYAFATVPLLGKGRVLGVILTDNLFNRIPITDEDVQFLDMFANQAGLAIENGLLYRNIEEVYHELQEAHALIVHQEKMAALGELSNTIAHEIKNPLTAIGGFARRLDRSISTESPEKRYTQTIIREVSRLEKILSDIGHYTHETVTRFHLQDLVHILEDSLALVSEEFGDGKIHLIREYAAETPKVMGDYLQLKMAFYNLIKNACESMDHRGTLSLQLSPLLKNGVTHVRVEIKDTGKGIEPDSLSNIFNPFYSTKGTRLGLGLPIVHKIVTSHRGQIEIDNRPGEGVTFVLTFPVSEKREA